MRTILRSGLICLIILLTFGCKKQQIANSAAEEEQVESTLHSGQLPANSYAFLPLVYHISEHPNHPGYAHLLIKHNESGNLIVENINPDYGQLSSDNNSNYEIKDVIGNVLNFNTKQSFNDRITCTRLINNIHDIIVKKNDLPFSKAMYPMIVEKENSAYAARLLIKENGVVEQINPVDGPNYQRVRSLNGDNNDDYELIDLSGKTFNFNSKTTFNEGNNQTGLNGDIDDIVIRKNGYTIYQTDSESSFYGLITNGPNEDIMKADSKGRIYAPWKLNVARDIVRLYRDDLDRVHFSVVGNNLNELYKYSIQDEKGNVCNFDKGGKIYPRVMLKGKVRVFYREKSRTRKNLVFSEF